MGTRKILAMLNSEEREQFDRLLSDEREDPRRDEIGRAGRPCSRRPGEDPRSGEREAGSVPAAAGVIFPMCSACGGRGWVVAIGSDWPIECPTCQEERRAAVRRAAIVVRHLAPIPGDEWVTADNDK